MRTKRKQALPYSDQPLIWITESATTAMYRAGIIIYGGQDHLSNANAMLALLAFATLPYLAANFGFAGRKIFLGDAGSALA